MSTAHTYYSAQDILAECSWGTVCDATQCRDFTFNPSFVINGRIWRPSPPFTVTPTRPTPQSMSFMQWVKSELPYPSKGGTDQRIKAQRRTFTLHFMELFRDAASNPYLDTHDAMTYKLQNAGLLVPSFLNLVHDLVAEKRSFSIIFRTFGTDIAAVRDAWNAFCGEFGYDARALREGDFGAMSGDRVQGMSLALGVDAESARNPCDRGEHMKRLSVY